MTCVQRVYFTSVHIFITFSLAISYNRPKLCAFASWNSNATTFANQAMVGFYPYSLFIDINNTIYVTERTNNRIQIWLNGNSNSLTNISSFSDIDSMSLFVTNEGDIYVDNGRFNSQVDRVSINATHSTVAMYVTGYCGGIFVDINNTLYCSATNVHQVVSKSLDDSTTTPRTIAGTDCAGSTSNRLNSPYGIFVDINFKLYVADSGNHRIQLFQNGQQNASTVAGSTASGTITLNWPSGVVLDVDGYLFIVDRGNHRIVGSGPTGFRCVAGCSGWGPASHQLNNPWTMAFDSYGNIFVVDTYNHRVQKFLLVANSCGK